MIFTNKYALGDLMAGREIPQGPICVLNSSIVFAQEVFFFDDNPLKGGDGAFVALTCAEGGAETVVFAVKLKHRDSLPGFLSTIDRVINGETYAEVDTGSTDPAVNLELLEDAFNAGRSHYVSVTNKYPTSLWVDFNSWLKEKGLNK